MSTVFISAHFIGKLGAQPPANFALSVEAMLKGLGLDTKVLSDGEGNIGIVACQEETTAVPPPEVAIVATAESPTPDLAGPELTIAIKPDDAIAIAAPPPEAAPPQPLAGQVYLKNLSSVCAVPFSIDSTLPESVLKVKELTAAPGTGQVAFSYCDMTFKLPVEKQGASVCNTNPQFTDTSIRSMVEFIGADSDIHPVLFKVVVGEESSVVFGSDMIPFVAQIMEKKSDPVPA